MATRHEAFHGRPRTPAESLGKNHRYLVDLAGVFDLSGRHGDDRDAGRKKRVTALRVVGYALASVWNMSLSYSTAKEPSGQKRSQQYVFFHAVFLADRKTTS